MSSQENTSYIYKADGQKVKKIFGTQTTDYLDGFQYQNGVLQFFPTSEGFYNLERQGYVFNYTDHLGNVRLSYSAADGGGIALLEENNYYPFGLKHEGYNSGSMLTNYAYKFGGKELQETGMTDFGARMYMNDLGRWGVIDNKAEKYSRFSGYTYAINNPIKYIDPDGNDVIIWYKASDGKMHSYDYKYGAGYTGKNKYLLAFHRSAKALIESGAGGNLKDLDARKERIYVREDTYEDSVGPTFDKYTMSVKWKPTFGLETDGDSNLSPTAILDHEMDHALDYLKDPNNNDKNLATRTNDPYDNLEEKRVIDGSEQATAKKLGLIKQNQVTRKNHRGRLYETGGVNTTKRKATEIEEVVITVKKKK